jgi:hypothetical protein|tara:strand:- start:1870 stop:2580 length:711 start_codon:yes stop_codon:yes gene_type:complete
MNRKNKIPSWLIGGPNDEEYRAYKLRGSISEVKKKIESNNLVEALFEIDDTLDYLYRYDAVQITHDPNPINQIVGGFDFPNLEMVFSSDEEMDTDEILDVLLDEAIDKYEDLHTICRDKWRIIEEGIKLNYVPVKPYFINDGFVFIKTPNNMLHVYHFIKPNKYFTNDWKKFEMTHMYSEKWTNETYFSRIDELVSKDSEKIIIRVDCKTETILENNALAVINQKIFSMLHRDYSF